jgi:hypothetical protein
LRGKDEAETLLAEVVLLARTDHALAARSCHGLRNSYAGPTAAGESLFMEAIYTGIQITNSISTVMHAAQIKTSH